MKKVILIYTTIVYLVCIILSSIEIFISGFKLEFLILVLFSFFTLISLYFIFKNSYIRKAYSFLWITNLMQSFSVIFFGLTYKLIIGPDLSLYIISSADELLKFSIKIFNIYSYFNFVKDDKTLALGINFIHLLLFVHFYNETKKKS